MLEIALVILVTYLSYTIYVALYFGSKKFQAVKSSIRKHTDNCNDLNSHIEHLKSSYSEVESYDYGESRLSDESNYQMKRKKWADAAKSNRTHNCSLSVCKNAHDQPFKYLCKYFNIKVNEETLSTFEEVLNNFSAAEQGKNLLKNERDAIVSSISKSIPWIIRKFNHERVIHELGFDSIDLSDLYFPIYTFQYVSAGGNSSSSCEIRLDINNLDRFVTYLNNLVKFKNSVAGQRALMTSSLREKIKIRDRYTCQICDLSTREEKNLLLEIDHIIPLSKGGVTSEGNLQTLCWKCNRTKGARMVSYTRKPAQVNYQ
ncbi:HNH endonuclease [Undibacterium sp. MH2W]|uniref:HNH endonuclease n=1 Tax=Undibacterium sp. MH2W TaxID=3413044 RepID=UPI003BEF964F